MQVVIVVNMARLKIILETTYGLSFYGFAQGVWNKFSEILETKYFCLQPRYIYYD